MEFKDFNEKYRFLTDRFNEQEIDERFRVSAFMYYEAIKELIRSKKNLEEVIKKTNERIKILSKSLDDDLKKIDKN